MAAGPNRILGKFLPNLKVFQHALCWLLRGLAQSHPEHMFKAVRNPFES